MAAFGTFVLLEKPWCSVTADDSDLGTPVAQVSNLRDFGILCLAGRMPAPLFRCDSAAAENDTGMRNARDEHN